MNIELLCNEYRENKRMIEELTALNEELKNKIVGNEHRAVWADVTQSKVDTKKLKEQFPQIAEQLTTQSTYKRFTFS